MTASSSSDRTPPDPLPSRQQESPRSSVTEARPLPDIQDERVLAQEPPEIAAPASRRGVATPATYALLGINIGVYLWMVLHGVSATSPSPEDLVHFGANVTDLVLKGQWYRLLTATFVHVGIVHLLTNMWCLYNLGLLGEPLLGRWGLTAVYLITGVAGNLLSLAVSVVMRGVEVGAGASGAVFGIAGILIVLLSNQRLPIPAFELKRLRRSVVQFAMLGTTVARFANIDNSAHVGGFLSGLALGRPLVPQMTAGRGGYLQRQKITFACAVFCLVLFAYWIVKIY